MLYHFVIKRTGRFTQVANLKNMGGVSLGGNRSVQMIMVGSEILIVGVGENVQLLKNISDPEIIESLTKKSDTQDLIEDNVMKAFKWTADHAFRSKGAQPVPGQKKTGTDFREQLESVNRERSEQLQALIRRGVKNE
nr:flagellar biosynthetic protein FliO [Sporolactobacillus mangiferae]